MEIKAIHRIMATLIKERSEKYSLSSIPEIDREAVQYVLDQEKVN